MSSSPNNACPSAADAPAPQGAPAASPVVDRRPAPGAGTAEALRRRVQDLLDRQAALRAEIIPRA